MSLLTSEKRLPAFHAEFEKARQLYFAGELAQAFHHFERAHILGQPWPSAHTRAHWYMLKIGMRNRDLNEIWGQIIRLAGGGLLSFLGQLPEGNTGGANVPAERPMPLPPDLKELCQR